MAQAGGTASKPKRIRFNVGADCGSSRFEVGDTAKPSVMPKATLDAWLEQGLVEWAD